MKPIKEISRTIQVLDLDEALDFACPVSSLDSSLGSAFLVGETRSL